jgi:hypothetical protein
LTLSQSYYFGSVNRSPHHRVVTVDGVPLDQLDHLAATARGKPQTQSAKLGGSGTGERVDEAAILELIRSGTSYHRAAIRLIGCWARRGLSYIDAEQKIRAAFEAVDKVKRDQRWHDRVNDIPDLLDHIFGKEAERQGECGRAGEGGAGGEGVRLEDFYAYMPMHNYIFVPCRTPWPAASVNARVPPVALSDASGQPIVGEKTGKQIKMPASTWLDQNRPVEQMTWAPGLPLLIRGRLVAEGGWFPRKGVGCLNLYRPPVLIPGNGGGAERWLKHVYAVYPEDAEHIILWLAHRVQCPAEKINHALVLGGEQGIGKDSLLEPIKRAVGPWNWQDESPTMILESRFNGYLKAVVLRVNEARDLGDFDRFPKHLSV